MWSIQTWEIVIRAKRNHHEFSRTDGLELSFLSFDGDFESPSAAIHHAKSGNVWEPLTKIDKKLAVF